MADVKILLGRDFLPVAIEQIKLAQKSIQIIIFDWRVYASPGVRKEGSLLNAVLDAKERGVTVQVIANNDYVTNELKKFKIECKRTTLYRIVHAKTILIDEVVAFIGSHNFTSNAFDRNLEVSVMVRDLELAARLFQFFQNLWANN